MGVAEHMPRAEGSLFGVDDIMDCAAERSALWVGAAAAEVYVWADTNGGHVGVPQRLPPGWRVEELSFGVGLTLSLEVDP